MEIATLGLVFLAGIVSFLSPCSAVSLPSFTALILAKSGAKSGVKKDAETETEYGGKVGGKAGTKNDLETSLEIDKVSLKQQNSFWIPALIYFLSFTAVLVLLGMVATASGLFLVQNKEILRVIGGIILIFLGGFMLVGYRLPALHFLYKDRVFEFNTSNSSTIQKYLLPAILGFTTAFAWTPCIGPVVGLALTFAGNAQQVWHGGFLLFVYSLGLNLPLFLIAILGQLFGEKVGGKFAGKKWNKIRGIIYTFAGLFIIVLGLVFIFNWLGFFYVFLDKLIPRFYLQYS